MADIDQVKAPTPSFSTPTLVTEYIGMLSSLERMLRARGIPVVAIGEGGSRFETLPQEQQAAIVQGVTKFYGLCNRIDELDKDKTDLSCVWWVIKELGLRPPHDLFEKLS